MQGDGWLDVPRTTRCGTTCSRDRSPSIKTGDWIDRPSVGIPYLYVATGSSSPRRSRIAATRSARNQVFDTAKNVALAVRLDELVRAPKASSGSRRATRPRRVLPEAQPTAPPAGPPTKATTPATPKKKP